MKSSALVYLAFTGLLLFCSCSSSFYKHQQSLKACTNRNDVLKYLGPPDEKIYTQTGEKWIYNLNYHHYKHAAPLIDSLDTTKAIHYEKYLQFTFNLQGSVITWQSNVDDPVRAIVKRDEYVTPWGIVGATLVLGLLVYIDAVTKTTIQL
jgi:hypothetical protein